MEHILNMQKIRRYEFIPSLWQATRISLSNEWRLARVKGPFCKQWNCETL